MPPYAIIYFYKGVINIVKIIYIYFILANLFTFLIFGIDKYKAIKNKYRIPESFLLTFVVLSGFLGAALGMILFKHKLSKKKFIVITIFSSLFYLLLIGIFIFNLISF